MSVHEPSDPSRLAITVERDADTVVLRLAGELDLGTAPLFGSRLHEVEDEGSLVVVDLRRVTFMDSSGIAQLLGAHRRARRRGVRFLAVRTPQTPVAQILNMTALERTFETAEQPPA